MAKWFSEVEAQREYAKAARKMTFVEWLLAEGILLRDVPAEDQMVLMKKR